MVECDGLWFGVVVGRVPVEQDRLENWWWWLWSSWVRPKKNVVVPITLPCYFWLHAKIKKNCFHNVQKIFLNNPDVNFFCIVDTTHSDCSVLIRDSQVKQLATRLNPDKIKKRHTRHLLGYQDWLQKHCIQRQYIFQIHKCEESCRDRSWFFFAIVQHRPRNLGRTMG